MFHNQVTWITLHYYEFGKLSYHSNWNDQLLVTLLFKLSKNTIRSGMLPQSRYNVKLNTITTYLFSSLKEPSNL